MSPRELVAQVGTKVTLRCEVLVPNAPAGCSWLFQPRHDAKGPTFLLYHSASGTKLAPGLEQKRFSPSKSSNTYTLTVNSFQKRDEGYYFCSVSGNMMLYFSPFVPVFLPGASAGRVSAGRLGAHPQTHFSFYVIFWFFETGVCCVAQAGLDLVVILLPLPS